MRFDDVGIDCFYVAERLAGRHAIRSRFGGIALCIMMLLCVNHVAFGQRNNIDYYAPRTKGEGSVEQMYTSSLNNHLRDGRDRLARGDYGAAKGEFEFVLHYVPNDPQALSGLSEVCVKWKSPVCDNSLEERLQKAIARNPNAAPTYIVQALHYHRKSNLERAVKVYKQAIDLAPDSINAHYNLGLAYADLKQYELSNLHAQKSYALGVTLPGLRMRLQSVGKWNPNVSLPARESKVGAESSPSNVNEKSQAETPGEK